MKRLLSIFMAMLLACGLCFSVSAQTLTGVIPVETPLLISEQNETTVQQSEVSSSEPVTEAPTESATVAPTAAPDESTTQPTIAPSTEPTPESPTEAPPETTVPDADPGTCDHSWIYVEVNPTCTEYGGRGYVCIYCEALKDLEAIDMIDHTYENACDAECNVCGSVRNVTHKYSTTWSKNSTQHWHACSVCGEKSDTGSHYPGPAATEEKAQYCLTCGLMMMPKKDHTHQYSATYTFDAAAHWFACKGCEERKASEAHSYDNPCDPDCNVCGYVSEKKHNYGTWESDKNGHWKICSLCAEMTQPEPHVTNPELPETAAHLCSVCDYVLSEESGHTHAGAGKWFCDEDNHWKLCKCGEKTEEGSHSWDEGVETAEAFLQYSCAVCGAEKREAMPQGSDSAFWWIPVSIAALLSVAIILIIFILTKFKFRKN